MKISAYKNHHAFLTLVGYILQKKCNHTVLKNLAGSSFNLIVSELFEKLSSSIILVFQDKEAAMYAYTDFVNIFGESNKIIYLPASYKRKLKNQYYDPAQIILRNKSLQQIQKNSNHILVTYIEAVCEKIIKKSEFSKCFLDIHINEILDIAFLEEVLQTYSFELTDFVHKPGQYAIRGAIVDVFSFSSEYPYRIEFDDDKIKSLRIFNIETQESIEFLDNIQITPDLSKNFSEKLNGSIFDFYFNDIILITYNALYFKESIKNYTTDRFIKDNEDIQHVPTFSFNELIEQFEQKHWIEYGQTIKEEKNIVKFNTIPQPAFNKNFEILKEDILDKIKNNYEVYILVEQELQKERLYDIFKNLKINDHVSFLPFSLNQGFIDNDLKKAYYTDHQIFNRFYKHKVKDKFLQSEILTFQEFNSLKPGDYVVHIDHGIGIFGGLEKIEINGKWQEQIKILFKDQACVYMSVHNLHKISKYKGSDGIPPKLSKLGSGQWQKLKQQTKDKVKDIARDLIKIYAERMQTKGYAFSPDTYLQEELEASFFFEDTPDQAKATKAIKVDMESNYPMDRLICGDVGFGKTEIAIRATFKAVADSKQVAVLVPTTILALQHYLTFKERLEKFPCNVEFLSRLKTNKQTKEILEKLKKGEIDIIIGTHKLLSNNVVFKDLGLLIIDEEQKFGVAAKEQIRKIKTNIDTLTLTATPIPRTLHFSLMGARDLSIIQTPPPNRQAIITEIHLFNKEIIKKAIEFELSRDGQVFFIHNKVNDIHQIKQLINELCPQATVAIGHGKMKPIELEQVILDFMQGHYDILLSTSIVENGIDIPNANTIIINNGHMFGLSDLHQLRGRVGRTNRKAFCYILIPPLDTLPAETKKRLQAIEEYSDLGSGFYIAMQDLDIRGSGNLLGAEQSGFIAEMGFETYQKILQEAIEEIKAEVISEKTSENRNNLIVRKTKLLQTDCTFETDLQIYIPEEYVENIAERIRLYKEIDSLNSEEEVSLFKEKLIDRFGPLPYEVNGLFDVLQIRWKAQQLGFEKISLKSGKLTCYFISNQQSEYYDSNIFKNILSYLQKSKKSMALKEANHKLYLQFDKITSLDGTIKIIDEIYQIAMV